jgi:hypothetical protein
MSNTYDCTNGDAEGNAPERTCAQADYRALQAGADPGLSRGARPLVPVQQKRAPVDKERGSVRKKPAGNETRTHSDGQRSRCAPISTWSSESICPPQ